MGIHVPRTSRRLALVAAGSALATSVLASPVAAAAGDSGSCVATFVEPQAEGSGQSGAPFGDTVRAFTVLFYPLGQTVSYQAGSARDACPFQPPA